MLARASLHLLDQPLHSPRAQEHLGWLGLRVDFKYLAAHSGQASNLVFLVLRVVYPWGRALSSCTNPPSIDFDDHCGGNHHSPGEQLPLAVLDGFPIPLLDEILTDFMGESANLTFADLDPGHDDCGSGIFERSEAGACSDHLLNHGATVGVLIQP
jgi:hypothetical protein